MKYISFLILFLIFFSQTGCQDLDKEYQYSLKNSEDKISSHKNGIHTRFNITSESGIGSAMITFTTDSRPREVSFTFKYSTGKIFSKLESIILTTDRLQLRSSSNDSGKMRFYLADSSGKYESNAPFAGTLNVNVDQNKELFEITLPANLFEKSQQVSISWIDFFR